MALFLQKMAGGTKSLYLSAAQHCLANFCNAKETETGYKSSDCKLYPILAA